MSISLKTNIATALILCGFQSISFAAECGAKSGAQITPLLELYTSEGCSSCPPADKWFGSLKTDNVTPLAFHVDYWDYIGWKDRFAKAEYSDRQRKTAALGGAGFVYTPQFVLNGRDFRGGSDSRLNSAIATAQKQPARAHLQLGVVGESDGSLTLKTNAEVSTEVLSDHSQVFVALYENHLVSAVNAGENSGSTLKHDYVVRELFGAYPLTKSAFSKNFTLNSAWKNKDAGAAIFVQNSQTGEILQSLRLPFCH